jgi:hypothetical protein
MKKVAAVLIAAGVILGASSAFAEHVTTDVVTVGVNEGGYAVVLDGSASNSHPGDFTDGYIGVNTTEGCVAGDTDGGPYSEPANTGHSPNCLT